MKFKPGVRYTLDFQSPWMTASAFFAGLSIFLAALYYLCFTEGWTAMSLLLPLILPALVLAAHGVLLRAVRLNVPVVYGALALAYFLVASPHLAGEWGVLSLVLFLLGAAVLIVTGLGYLPTRGIALLLLLLPLVLRLFGDAGTYLQSWEAIPPLLKAQKFKEAFTAVLDTIKIVPILPELSALAGAAAFACFPMCMKRTEVK